MEYKSKGKQADPSSTSNFSHTKLSRSRTYTNKSNKVTSKQGRLMFLKAMCRLGMVHQWLANEALFFHSLTLTNILRCPI